MNYYLSEKIPVPKAVAKMVIPSIISMLGIIIYNMADTFFVGQTGDAGQVAAISLAMPVFLIFMAVGNIYGIGAGSLISRLIGQGEKDTVFKISSFSFYASIITGILIIAVYYLGMDTIIQLIDSNDKTNNLTRIYLSKVTIGAPFVVLSAAFSHIVRSEGAANQSMIGMLLGNIVNIILDPIMILWMNMGVEGAAWATVIGNLIGAIYYIWYLFSKNTILSIAFKNIKIEKRQLWEIFAIGIAASMANLLMSFSNILINNVLNNFENGEIQVAAMGVAIRASLLVVLLQMGFAIGIQPLVGFSYGAKNLTRLKKVVLFTALSTTVTGLVLSGIYILMAENIVKTFINDQAVVATGIKMLNALMFSGPIVGVLFILTFSLQAMGKIKAAFILNISRQGFFFIPVLYISNVLFGLNGVIYSQPIADIISYLSAIIIYTLILKKLSKQWAKQGIESQGHFAKQILKQNSQELS